MRNAKVHFKSLGNSYSFSSKELGVFEVDFILFLAWSIACLVARQSIRNAWIGFINFILNFSKESFRSIFGILSTIFPDFFTKFMNFITFHSENNFKYQEFIMSGVHHVRSLSCHEFILSGVCLSSGVCLGTINNKPTFTLTCLNRNVFSAVLKGENISNIWGLHALREYASVFKDT